MKISVHTDGTTVYTFRQSWLNEYLLCPERARQVMMGEAVDHETDSTALGTGLHLSVELFVLGDDYNVALVNGWDQFVDLMELPGARWVKTRTWETAQRDFHVCFESWHQNLWPQVSDVVAVEEPFNLLLDRSGDDVVRISGTIDLVDAGGVWDWKTAGDDRKYKAGFGGEGWKLRRWGIQPTVYSYASNLLYGVRDFSYGVCLKGPHGGVQRLDVERSEADWERLKALCWNVVEVYKANPHGPWPTLNNHALCSDLYCPAWNSCPLNSLTLIDGSAELTRELAAPRS